MRYALHDRCTGQWPPEGRVRAPPRSPEICLQKTEFGIQNAAVCAFLTAWAQTQLVDACPGQRLTGPGAAAGLRPAVSAPAVSFQKWKKTAGNSIKIPEDRICAVRRAQIRISGSEKARLHLRCVRSKPETRELAVFLWRCIITTLAPRRRMRAASVENSVLALAPAQTGSRLAGLGPTDGCATAFSPLPPQMRPSEQSVRGQPTQSARRPRWSAPATKHCRRVCGGGVPPTGVGDS